MALRVRNGVRERQQADGSWAVADSPQDKQAQVVAAATAQVGASLDVGPSALEGASLDAAIGALDLSGQPSGGDEDAISDAALIESLKVGGGAANGATHAVADPAVGPDGPHGGDPPRASDSTVADQPAPPAAGEYLSADGGAETDAQGWEDIPGLTSDDGRGTSGSRKIRDRLRSRGAGKRGPQPAGGLAGKSQKRPLVRSHVKVPQTAAEITGPAVDDTTRNRVRDRVAQGKTRRNGVAQGDGKGARYVNSRPPALLSGRPKWVQDLFEAHFRSDETLAMRRIVTGYTADGKPKNRMKLSREDFAIGWLTAFDQFREDTRLLRAGDKGKD